MSVGIKTLTLKSVEVAGVGGSIVGTAAAGDAVIICSVGTSTTYSMPGQQVTISNRPSIYPLWSRMVRLTSDAIFCMKSGASNVVAISVAAWSQIAATIESSLTFAPVIVTNPVAGTATEHDGTNVTPEDFTATVASELVHCPIWKEGENATSFSATPLTTIGIYDVGTAASGTLTSDGTAPSNGDVVTIGHITYTFRTTLTTSPATVAYEVLIGGSAAIALDNLALAINGGATIGTNYSTGTVAHPMVSAAATNTDTTQVVTALGGGTSMNACRTTEGSDHLSWGAAALAGGAASAAGDGCLRVSPTTEGTKYYRLTAVNAVGSNNSNAAALVTTAA